MSRKLHFATVSTSPSLWGRPYLRGIVIPVISRIVVDLLPPPSPSPLPPSTRYYQRTYFPTCNVIKRRRGTERGERRREVSWRPGLLETPRARNSSARAELLGSRILIAGRWGKGWGKEWCSNGRRRTRLNYPVPLHSYANMRNSHPLREIRTFIVREFRQINTIVSSNSNENRGSSSFWFPVISLGDIYKIKINIRMMYITWFLVSNQVVLLPLILYIYTYSRVDLIYLV